jgi:hypothetical protein
MTLGADFETLSMVRVLYGQGRAQEAKRLYEKIRDRTADPELDALLQIPISNAPATEGYLETLQAWLDSLTHFHREPTVRSSYEDVSHGV